MARNQSLPLLWLITDERNDAVLERAMQRLPRGSGVIFRHYHLSKGARRARFCRLRRKAHRYGHSMILADGARIAKAWGADGVYGAPRAFGPRRAGLVRLATAHDLAEIGLANRHGVDAVLLSPVFATRSHPGAGTLGPVRFRLLARHARAPVVALGGIDAHSARTLRWACWAAIDGLSP